MRFNRMYMTAFISRHSYLRFQVVKSLPMLGDPIDDFCVADIEPIRIYEKQLYNNVHDYNYYKVIVVDSDDNDYVLESYVCVRKDDDNETEYE